MSQNVSLSITGLSGTANLSLSDSETAVWTARAAMLDPVAYTYSMGANLNLTVPSGKTWYLLSGWYLMLGNTGQWLFHRVISAKEDFALALPAGTNLTTAFSQIGYAYICDPSLVCQTDIRYSDPKKLYFDRLAMLNTLALNETQVNIPAASARGTPASASFDNDFANGIVTLVSNLDASWMGLTTASGGAMNVDNEISDDHQWRSGRAVCIPFQRSVMTGINARAASVDGQASSFSSLAGRAAALYVKLPTGW